MIKLTVSWHQECRNCGTELVVQLAHEEPSAVLCPWCGEGGAGAANLIDSEFVSRMLSEVRAFEERLNSEIIP